MISQHSRRMYLGVLAVMATFMAFIATHAIAQVGPQGPPPAPCNTYWVDQDVSPGSGTANITWAAPTNATSDPVPLLNNLFHLGPPSNPPGTMGVPQSFTLTFCGVTIGPFTFNYLYCVPDPCHPGQCIMVRSYFHPGSGMPGDSCFHEFQALRNLCPEGMGCK